MTAVSSDTGWQTIDHRLRWVFGFSSAMAAAFLLSLIFRANGSYWAPLDGWGVDLFELSMGVLCICRYFEKSWRSNQSTAKVFPIVLGAACLSWALGDVALTFESLGGATPPVPSVADGFYVGFFPLCYIALMMLIRRENRKSLVATSLDGLMAGLGVAALLAAFMFSAILTAAGGGASCGRNRHGLSGRRPAPSGLGDRWLCRLAEGVPAVPWNRKHRFDLQCCRRPVRTPPARQQDRLRRQCRGVAGLSVDAGYRYMDSARWCDSASER